MGHKKLSWLTRSGHVLMVFFRLGRAALQIARGVWYLSGLKQPVVTIFGGSRLSSEDRYSKIAHELGHALTHQGISVITGAGPGVMAAANCGAARHPSMNIGIGLTGLESEQQKNSCVSIYLETGFLFGRKWLLMEYSQVLVFFPGGFGTLDELTEILTLFQTGRRAPIPVILVGEQYWRSLLTWLQDQPTQMSLIDVKNLATVTILDDFDHIFNLIIESVTI